jgi:hypothetical protein
MPITIANGRKEQDKDSVGGFKALYFINNQIVKSDITYDATNTDVIDTIVNVDTLYKFELKGDNSFNQTIMADPIAGTTYFEQNLSIKLKKQDAQTSKNVKLLAYSMPHCILQDYNGKFYIAGLLNGLDLVGGEISGGGKMADFNGYSLIFKGEEVCYANLLDATTEAAMLTLFTAATMVTV